MPAQADGLAKTVYYVPEGFITNEQEDRIMNNCRVRDCTEHDCRDCDRYGEESGIFGGGLGNMLIALFSLSGLMVAAIYVLMEFQRALEVLYIK
jgi:hypothetical protein